MSDVVVLAGMAVAMAAGIYDVRRGCNPFCRAGSAFSAVAPCVGLAYFGYGPFFGGTDHDIEAARASWENARHGGRH